MCVCAHTHTQLLNHVLFFWDPRTVVSVPGSSVNGILQVRILEWVAISFRGSSNPGLETHVSYMAGRFFTTEPPGNL